ncbi:unnamed protein product [Miscanthus lutarioriparius]|uniref:Uncharacterized protein n=1 Tax=Miscanthus lutarioriparius TaxID=422564 RepID=A0A811SDK9_9POAL|nr:unnamed protein product [Miscanthus lutarioriparius]
MPPRKRPPPPPEEPSPSSKPLLDAQQSEPSKPTPDSEQPTISATILAQLPTQERLAYKLIFEAGNKGMWMLDIRKKLLMGPNIATKVVRTLVGQGSSRRSAMCATAAGRSSWPPTSSPPPRSPAAPGTTMAAWTLTP